jgi:hypothetical protein
MKKEERVSPLSGMSDRNDTDRRRLEQKRNDDGVPTATIEDAIGELPLLAGLVAVANVAVAYLLVRRTTEAVSGLRAAWRA